MKKLYLIILIGLLFFCFGFSPHMRVIARKKVATIVAACDHDYTTTDSDTTTAGALGYRIILLGSTLPCDGTKIRITLEAHSTNASIIDGTSIGIRSTTTEDFTGAPTRITWDSGSSTKTITASETATSDWMDFTFTAATAYLIHIYMADHGTQYIRRHANDSVQDAYYDENAAGDDTLTVDWTADSSTNNFPFMVTFEVY